jgi:hypothetical protein
VSIDETADASGREVANAVNEALRNDQTLSEKSSLPPWQETSAVNYTTGSATASTETMQTPWPDGVEFDSLLLLVTEAPPYMAKAERCPKPAHVACAVEASDGVSGRIRVLC